MIKKYLCLHIFSKRKKYSLTTNEYMGFYEIYVIKLSDFI